MSGSRFRPEWMSKVEAALHKHHVDIQRLWKNQPQTPAEWAGNAIGNLGPATTTTSTTTTSTTTTSTTPDYTSTTPTPSPKCCTGYSTSPRAWFVVEAGQITALSLTTDPNGNPSPCNCGINPGDTPVLSNQENPGVCWYTSSGFTTAHDVGGAYDPPLEPLCAIPPAPYTAIGNRWGFYHNQINILNPVPFGTVELTNCCIYQRERITGKVEWSLIDGNPCLFETLTFRTTNAIPGGIYGCWQGVPEFLHLLPL